MSHTRWSVRALQQQIANWANNLARIDGELGPDGKEVTLRLVDGRSQTLTRAEVDAWRLRVDRLADEFIARVEARDWAWCDWVAEYGDMLAATIHEDHDEKHARNIESGIKAHRSQRKANEAKSAKSRAAKEAAGKAGKRKSVVSDRQLRRLKSGK
jgi:hypothetical protein